MATLTHDSFDSPLQLPFNKMTGKSLISIQNLYPNIYCQQIVVHQWTKSWPHYLYPILNINEK